MAIDLTGITNENEFYTHHYLAAILENDLKAVLEAWAKLENPPYEELKALAKPFQTMLREPDRAAQSALRVQWFADLFAVLGYPLTPEDYEFEDGTVLRLAGQISKANGQP
ncbi:MAG: hypothetical protein EBY17_31485, partial [Acidobacteriia bacterium]|nr:hypothetical protein [Terriglobia bacterium]